MCVVRPALVVLGTKTRNRPCDPEGTRGGSETRTQLLSRHIGFASSACELTQLGRHSKPFRHGGVSLGVQAHPVDDVRMHRDPPSGPLLVRCSSFHSAGRFKMCNPMLTRCALTSDLLPSWPDTCHSAGVSRHVQQPPQFGGSPMEKTQHTLVLGSGWRFPIGGRPRGQLRYSGRQPEAALPACRLVLVRSGRASRRRSCSGTAA